MELRSPRRWISDPGQEATTSLTHICSDSKTNALTNRTTSLLTSGSRHENLYLHVAPSHVSISFRIQVGNSNKTLLTFWSSSAHLSAYSTSTNQKACGCHKSCGRMPPSSSIKVHHAVASSWSSISASTHLPMKSTTRWISHNVWFIQHTFSTRTRHIIAIHLSSVFPGYLSAKHMSKFKRFQ